MLLRWRLESWTEWSVQSCAEINGLISCVQAAPGCTRLEQVTAAAVFKTPGTNSMTSVLCTNISANAVLDWRVLFVLSGR